MNDFAIVAIVLALFLGFGMVMGVLVVSAFSRGKAHRYPDDSDRWQSPEDDDQPPRWPGT